MKLRPFLLLAPVFVFGFAYAQVSTGGFDPSLRPVTHIEKAENEGWIEDVLARTSHSTQYKNQEGKVISFNSNGLVNYTDAGGKLVPLDIRCKQTGSGFESLLRPDPIRIDKNGNASFLKNTDLIFEFGKTQNLNGKTNLSFSTAELTNASHLVFKNIVTGIDKWFDFKETGVKYSYALNSPQIIDGSTLKITEEYVLPEGCEFSFDQEEGAFENGLWKGSILIKDIRTNVNKGKISPLICYDKSNNVVQGYYKIIPTGKKNVYQLEMNVSAEWLNNVARTYPVVIDPLVTGPTTTWSGGIMPSCFFPTYHSDSILVTVPAGITIDALNVTSSFYADPFTTTVMADGRMYFSTSCGQTTIFQVLPPAGLTAGTAYLDNYDMHNPLMCCHPQSCPSYTFYLTFNISRTSNGPLCNTAYLRYDPGTTSWPFSAYVVGYTAEAYGSEMGFIPGTICANTCTVDARIFCKYGVPPFTFTHPWSADTIVAGLAVGCGIGSTLQILPLDIPSCPNYCDPSTTLVVPGPVVYDACGTLVSGFNPTYNLTIKPAATVAFDTDSLQFCSGGSFTANVTACLPGATITWTGNGNSGTTLVNETLYNTGSTVSATMYYASVVINGCTGPLDSMVIFTNPYVVDSFSVGTSPYLVNQPINFTNLTQLNGNMLTGDFWNFGDGSGSILSSDTNVYSDTGYYQICHMTSTLLGCNDTSCQTIHIIDIELQYPNIITPNGDGKNDALYFKALEYYPENTLVVFNRWGNEIYRKENYTNDWKAPDITDGVYYYVLLIPTMDPVKSILHINRK